MGVLDGFDVPDDLYVHDDVDVPDDLDFRDKPEESDILVGLVVFDGPDALYGQDAHAGLYDGMVSGDCVRNEMVVVFRNP